MNCIYCGKEYKGAPWQMYCSALCGNRARKKYSKQELQLRHPQLDGFFCAYCGKWYLPARGERKFRFCSAQCERNWWRHPRDYGTGTRLVTIPARRE